MAVYTPVLTYTFRDTLGNTDPNKVIKGAYLDGEFSAIHSASLDAASLAGANTFAGSNVFSGTNAFNSNVTIGAAASGVSLSVTGIGGGTATQNLIGPTGTVNTLATGGSLGLTNGTTSGTILSNNGAQSELWQFDGSSWSQILKVLTTRGVVINAPASGSALLVTGASSNLGLTVQQGTSTASGIRVTGPSGGGAGIDLTDGGTGTRTWSLFSGNAGVGIFSVFDNTASITRLQVSTSGVISGYGPVAAAQVDMTPDQSSWTTTLSGGFSSNPTGTVKWRRVGGNAFIWVDANITGTSNATNDISFSALPAAITPAATRYAFCYGVNNAGGGGYAGVVQVLNAGTMILSLLSGSFGGIGMVGISPGATFTNTGAKGVLAGWTITYPL